MNNPFKDYKLPEIKKSAQSERAEVIGMFLNRLNEEREMGNYKPLKPARVGMLLAHLDMWDLKMFYASCDNARNFSKNFWYSLRVK